MVIERGSNGVNPDVDDAFLVQRAQEGYLDAFTELVNRHGKLAYRVALRLLGNHHDAEDVAQEALVAAWQQLPRFKAESNFSTWLYRIVTRRALNRMTRTKPTDSTDLLDELDEDKANGPALSAERNQAIDAVTQAVTALPPAQRIVVVLYHFEGLRYEDIARVADSTVPAVRSHLFRARRTLTQMLDEWR
ncbi:MAG: putative polymerase ECF-subfamily sigma factor [Frankiales bacterium]|nr:putative polymerase ECF-subfamily sigma factor [Frankiales bacterium]